jgi:hypothetical protein
LDEDNAPTVLPVVVETTVLHVDLVSIEPTVFAVDTAMEDLQTPFETILPEAFAVVAAIDVLAVALEFTDPTVFAVVAAMADLAVALELMEPTALSVVVEIAVVVDSPPADTGIQMREPGARKICQGLFARLEASVSDSALLNNRVRAIDPEW